MGERMSPEEKFELFTLTADERQETEALRDTMRTLTDLWIDRELTPEALRMAVATIRRAGDVYAEACDRWERRVAEVQR